MTANTNAHSHKIRELAQAVTANVQVPLLPAQAEQVKAYLETLADIHEYLSDTEFSSESLSEIDDMFGLHGLDLFGMDHQLDAAQLDSKYSGDGEERVMPGQHPKYPKHQWLTMAAENKTVLGYWAWVEVMLSQED